MPSKFGWVDFADEDRKKMLNVVQLFRERDTRDELGIGTIRDAFADFFFPGTSTIQTRVKYMLFVPWIYSQLEVKRVTSPEIQSKARKLEIKLIYALLNNGEHDGVIGQDAKWDLQRLPSNIYWTGLAAWGIRLFHGSQDQYHRSLDNYYYHQRSVPGEEADNEFFNGTTTPNWHPGIVKPAKDLFDGPTLELTSEEARYLKEQVLIHHAKSLLANLLDTNQLVDTDFPWKHPVARSLSPLLDYELQYARNFSELIHGASLLYNFLLAEALDIEEWKMSYEKRLARWEKMLDERQNELWDFYTHLGDFWKLNALTISYIPLQTRGFVNRWMKFVFESPGADKIINSRIVRLEIASREVQLKGKRARLGNKRALELWEGESGTAPLNYRWNTASKFAVDIIKGMNRR